MTTQLTLLPTATAPWLLDDTTRAIGRQGLAEARRVLAAARANAGADDALIVAAHAHTHAAAA
jgi:hypothetical protein